MLQIQEMFKESVVLVDFGDLLVWFTRAEKMQILKSSRKKTRGKKVRNLWKMKKKQSLSCFSLYTLYLCKEMTHYGFIIIHMKKGKDLFLVVLKEASSSQQSSIIVQQFCIDKLLSPFLLFIEEGNLKGPMENRRDSSVYERRRGEMVAEDLGNQ